jgi:NADH:ubiquinone oxidoreductase subunit 3 (subunit A)
MLTSGKLLSDALEKYRKKKERFSTGDSISAGAVSAIDTGLLVFAIIFFVMEIILIFYAIIIAFTCTEPGPERIVHVVLAVFFTIPYVLLMVIFNKCATKTLKSGANWSEQ